MLVAAGCSCCLLLLQHKEVIPLLRHHGACDFPLKIILRAVAADVEAQKEQPGLLQHVLGHIRAWINECKARELVGAPPCPPPNLRDCGAWLPGVGETQLQGTKAAREAEEAAANGDTETADAATTTPPTKDPQLINAIGEVAREYNDAPAVEGEEDAASGWASFHETHAACPPIG